MIFQAGLLQPPVRIGPLLFSVLLGLIVFFSFPSFLSCRGTGSVIFLLLLLLLLYFCLFFGFGLFSFTSSSLSSPGLLFAMNVSKETRTCFLVNSTPHLLAAPSTWLPMSSPPALKIPRSLSLSSKSLERLFEAVGRPDSNTAAFCGHWNTFIVCFLTSEVVFFFFASSSTEVFSSFNCIVDSSCLSLIWSMINCLPCSGNM